MPDRGAEVHRKFVFEFPNLGVMPARVKPIELFGKELVESAQDQGRVVKDFAIGQDQNG